MTKRRKPSDASFYMTREEAVAEALCQQCLEDGGEDALVGPNDGDAVVPVKCFIGTAALSAATGMGRSLADFPDDFAVMAWSEQVAPHLLGREIDGVWWRERYGPEAWTAPRGGIFPSRLTEWSAARVPITDLDYDELLAAMPKTVLARLSTAGPPARIIALPVG